MGLTAEQKKEYQREYMRKKRSNSGSNKTEGLTEENVRPISPSPADGWPDVRDYISREVPGMPNLERLQRIAGSLGKNAGEVMFGITGLTMEDIGNVVGTMEGKYCL